MGRKLKKEIERTLQSKSKIPEGRDDWVSLSDSRMIRRIERVNKRNIKRKKKGKTC